MIELSKLKSTQRQKSVGTEYTHLLRYNMRHNNQYITFNWTFEAEKTVEMEENVGTMALQIVIKVHP